MADDRESASTRAEQEAQWRAAEGERLLVVGLGASAGGLDALERLFRLLPASSGFAFVVVQHLDPEHESILAELLGRAATIPVAFAKNGQSLERDHVYVMPRDSGLVVEGGKLRLVAAEPRAARMPINAFLTSLAEDLGQNAVAVVLSGTGSDGAVGVGAVKRHGGLTLAQLPTDARYESMPQAAIATGMVDLVLPVEQIPTALAEHARDRRDHPVESARGEAEGLREAFELLGQKTGHDFSQYKRSTVLRRLQRRVAATGTGHIREYVALLQRDAAEIQRLTDDLMINVTGFFRDDEPFQALARIVIPDLLERKPAEEIRVWVPGCSSGEEVYSIAMLLREGAEPIARQRPMKIFGTDIDASALAEARRGRYTDVVTRQVDEERLARFFVRRGDSYTCTKELRDLCIFTAHDLTRDPPFSRMDLVSCRNLLIYLNAPLQRRVVELLHYALRPGGYLLLGKAEVVDGADLELFEEVEKADRVYRRREVERRVGFPRLPGRGGARAFPLEAAPPARRGGPEVRSAADRSRGIVLEEYAPPSVVVDGRGEVRYYWGANLAWYLPPQAGPPASNLLHLVRRELKVELSGALHNAARHDRPVTRSHVVLTVEGVEHRLNLVVRPLPATEQDPDELFLIVFQEVAPPPTGQGAPLDEPSLERYREVQAELESARERLQFTVDELENANEALRSSNEQFQSMNEELHSSNEELQTSQEELQSVNEELNTVNAELSKKVDELELLYGDLQNLFQSTKIATVFLDRQFRIARFTPEAMAVFHLAEGDVGRPLSDFAARFDAKDVAQEVERVLATLEPVERTVRTVGETRWFLMRMHAYRTPSNLIAGVVISFIDVTRLKEIEAALRLAVEERERAERALLEADRRKNEFLAMLSHELRNPLAPIRNGLYLLERALPADSTGAQRAREIIERQVGHMTRIVDDLLDVTRVSSGKLQVQRQPVDLRSIVERTGEDLRSLFTTRGLTLEVTCPERPVWIHGDPTRLAQMIGNLLQNSAKFTPSGGSAALALDVVERSAEVRVRDDGVGIEVTMLSRLFQPFSQAEATLARSRGGLGLGLALVKGLVDLHGGTVEAKSAGTGEGSEFVIRLPLLATPPVALVAETVEASGPRRILVIEDNLDSANSLRDVLADEGHTVEVAYDGPEGLAKAREFGPEIVLCDVGLPGKDGYEVARALRGDGTLRGAFLIALTGYAGSEDRHRATDAGFDFHVAKPATIDQLRDAIGRAGAPSRAGQGTPADARNPA